MNEHIKKGEDALESGDLQTAIAEFRLAKSDPSIVTRRIAENRLIEIKNRKLLENKSKKNHKIQTDEDSAKYGYLSDLGYHVGNEGIPKRERQNKLKDAFYDQVILKEERWGPARSSVRFDKLCSWLRYRVDSNSERLEMTDAVTDWDNDLHWLESEFIKEAFNKE